MEESMIENYKDEFQEIVLKSEEIQFILSNINDNLVFLKMNYNEIIKKYSKNMLVFPLDSFYFQYKLLDFEIENFSKTFNLINNRMYGDYYKLYNVILTYCKNNNILGGFNHYNNGGYNQYKDLNSFQKYDIQEINALQMDIFIVMQEILIYCMNRERLNNSIFISKVYRVKESAFVGEVESKTKPIRETLKSKTKELNSYDNNDNLKHRNQVFLYLNYLSYFYFTQKENLSNLLIKITESQKQLDINILSNNADILLNSLFTSLQQNISTPLSTPEIISSDTYATPEFIVSETPPRLQTLPHSTPPHLQTFQNSYKTCSSQKLIPKKVHPIKTPSSATPLRLQTSPIKTNMNLKKSLDDFWSKKSLNVTQTLSTPSSFPEFLGSVPSATPPLLQTLSSSSPEFRASETPHRLQSSKKQIKIYNIYDNSLNHVQDKYEDLYISNPLK